MVETDLFISSYTSKGMLQAPGSSEDRGLGPFDTDGKNLYDITGQVFATSNGNLLGGLAGTNNSYFPTAVLTDFQLGKDVLAYSINGILGFDFHKLCPSGVNRVTSISTLPLTGCFIGEAMGCIPGHKLLYQHL